MERAGLGRRLAAIFIDWLVALLTTSLFGRLTQFEAQLIPLLIFFVEVSVLTALTGASLGQRLCGLQVESVSASPLTPGRAILRTFLICLVLPAVFMKEGRGYHDHFAQTHVVRASKN